MDGTGLLISGTKLIRYSGNDEMIMVPHRVKEIGAGAFYGNKTIKAVYLPQNIEIEESAFEGCSNLEVLTHDNEPLFVFKLDRRAFCGCENLRTDIVFTGRKIGSFAFSSCKNLRVVELPNRIEIADYAFLGCNSLERLCHVEDIWVAGKLGPGAFEFCYSLQSKIRVTEDIVRESTFDSCYKIQNVFLLQNVELEKDAFWSCRNLETVCEKGDVIQLRKIGIRGFSSCGNLKTDIRLTDKIVPDDAFNYCKNVKHFYIPAGSVIGEDAFKFCDTKKVIYEGIPIQEKNRVMEPFPRPKRIIPKEKQIEDDYIRFNDFLVLTYAYDCRNNGHDLQEVRAVVYCLTRTGEVIEKKVMVGYCRDCKRYYLLKKEFDRLKVGFILLCRVIDDTEPSTNETGVFADFNKESIMKQYGYSVSQVRGLSAVQRKTILEFLLVGNVLTRAEICSHLDWLIGIRSYDEKRYQTAIDKWQDDRRFIEEYESTYSRDMLVQRITRGRERN